MMNHEEIKTLQDKELEQVEGGMSRNVMDETQHRAEWWENIGIKQGMDCGPNEPGKDRWDSIRYRHTDEKEKVN